MYYAMGYKENDFSKPMVGVANGHSTITPCNSGLQKLADAAVDALEEAGAKAQLFGTPTVSDGIGMGTEAMKYSLVSREVIADSVELSIRGHSYDALVGVAGCDKSLPGMMMAMLRLNVPSVFLYGGSILPGRHKGKDITVQEVFEAVGAHAPDADNHRRVDGRLLKLLGRVRCVGCCH
jgi:dihydroxy-acid dehydratase